MKKKLILASASPRRKEILEQMGLTFAICPASGEERLNTEDPEEAVKARKNILVSGGTGSSFRAAAVRASTSASSV